MCLSAIYWARIKSLTFAATRSDAAALNFDDAFIYEEVSRPVKERSIEIAKPKLLKELQWFKKVVVSYCSSFANRSS